MKISLYKELLSIVLVVVFSQSLFAADNASATKTIASVLVDLNHSFIHFNRFSMLYIVYSFVLRMISIISIPRYN